MSGEKGYPSTCAASSSAKRRDEIPRKLEITQNLHLEMVFLNRYPCPLVCPGARMRIENQCDRVRRSSLRSLRDLMTSDRCGHYVALFYLFVPKQVRELQQCLPPAITGNIFVYPICPRGGLRRTIIVGNDRIDLNLSRLPFVTIIKSYTTTIVNIHSANLLLACAHFIIHVVSCNLKIWFAKAELKNGLKDTNSYQ
ncbi:hypothetical protein G5I_07973 [Acromyrmex echinatior]|uniref:Uncharacterized protein n=1 Tax=Acromyrmex echinatior TaxID=103372 RepID=F4WQ89_ACREC|nr:hypothetical protein G5I_07973 [Acromyrmex echinatior]